MVGRSLRPSGSPGWRQVSDCKAFPEAGSGCCTSMQSGEGCRADPGVTDCFSFSRPCPLRLLFLLQAVSSHPVCLPSGPPLPPSPLHLPSLHHLCLHLGRPGGLGHSGPLSALSQSRSGWFLMTQTQQAQASLKRIPFQDNILSYISNSIMGTVRSCR